MARRATLLHAAEGEATSCRPSPGVGLEPWSCTRRATITRLPVVGLALLPLFASVVCVSSRKENAVTRPIPTTDSQLPPGPWLSRSRRDRRRERCPPSRLPNGVVASIEVFPGGYPLSVTTAYGTVWVSHHRQTIVNRISPRTNKIVATIDVGRESCGRLVAGFGKVWMPRCDEPNGFVVDRREEEPCGQGRSQRLRPSGRCRCGQLPGCPGWNGTIQRIDPKTLKPTAVLKVGGAWLTFDGTSMWALSGEGVLSQIDPAKNEVIWTTTLPERFLVLVPRRVRRPALALFGCARSGAARPGHEGLRSVARQGAAESRRPAPRGGDGQSLVAHLLHESVSHRPEDGEGERRGIRPQATACRQSASGRFGLANSGDSTVWRDRIPK